MKESEYVGYYDYVVHILVSQQKQTARYTVNPGFTNEFLLGVPAQPGELPDLKRLCFKIKRGGNVTQC